MVQKYINTTSKSLAPGLDVVALFRRDDECMLSFAGTTGLAEAWFYGTSYSSFFLFARVFFGFCL